MAGISTNLELETSREELLRRAREHDVTAFRLLIRAHNRHLYRIARSVLADDQEASMRHPKELGAPPRCRSDN